MQQPIGGEQMRKLIFLLLCSVCFVSMAGCSDTYRDLADNTDTVVEDLVDAKDNFIESLAETTDNIFNSLADFFNKTD